MRSPTPDHAHFEAEVFAICLSRLRRAAEHASSVSGSHRIPSAIDAFDAAVPDVKDVRDVLEHFDAYLQNRGNLQKAGVMPPGFDVVAGSTSAATAFIEVGPRRFNTGVAVPAAKELADVVLAELGRLGGPTLSES